MINDVKIPVYISGNNTLDYYRVGIVNSNDYSPFGVQLDGRTITSDRYRYGFNGMESDDEVKGVKNSYTTEFRQYDPRIGKWLTIDPVFKAQESPYASNGNNPIWYIDPNGADSIKVGGAWFWEIESGDTYSEIGKKTGVGSQRLQEINSQPAKNLKIGSLLSLSKAKSPISSTPSTNSSGTTPSSEVPDWAWDMIEEVPTTELSLSMTAVQQLGGLDKAKKLLESGKFEVKYNGAKKTWSLKFQGNQHVDAQFVKSSKVRAMDVASRNSSALKVVKGVGITMNFVGLAVTAHNAYTEITTTGSVSVETGADAVFGVVGFMGPIGTGVSAAYFILKPMAKGIHQAAIDSGATLDHYGNVSYEEMWELFKSGW